MHSNLKNGYKSVFLVVTGIFLLLFSTKCYAIVITPENVTRLTSPNTLYPDVTIQITNNNDTDTNCSINIVCIDISCNWTIMKYNGLYYKSFMTDIQPNSTQIIYIMLHAPSTADIINYTTKIKFSCDQNDTYFTYFLQSPEDVGVWDYTYGLFEKFLSTNVIPFNRSFFGANGIYGSHIIIGLSISFFVGVAYWFLKKEK